MFLDDWGGTAKFDGGLSRIQTEAVTALAAGAAAPANLADDFEKTGSA